MKHYFKTFLGLLIWFFRRRLRLYATIPKKWQCVPCKILVISWFYGIHSKVNQLFVNFAKLTITSYTPYETDDIDSDDVAATQAMTIIFHKL